MGDVKKKIEKLRCGKEIHREKMVLRNGSII